MANTRSIYLEKAVELDALVQGAQMALCVSAIPAAAFAEGCEAESEVETDLAGFELADITGRSLPEWVAELHNKDRILVGVVSFKGGQSTVRLVVDISESFARLLGSAVASHVARKSWEYVESLGLVTAPSHSSSHLGKVQ